MQINPSQQNTAEVIRDVPARLLASLAEGEKLQATVIAKLSATSVKLQVANTILQISSQQALQLGQQVELQHGSEAGKPVLKILQLVTPNQVEARPEVSITLKPGQQVAVEVIKLLAENRLLVTPTVTSEQTTVTKNNVLPSQQLLTQNLPRQIEVDVSTLKQAFKAGDKLSMEVLQAQPLAVKIKADSPPSKAELIQNYQRTTLPQIDKTTANLPSLNKVLTEVVLPKPVQQQVQQLFQGLTEKSGLQQADTLRQALSNSGNFLEPSLNKQQGASLQQQDFKANLLQLAQVIKQQVQQPLLARVADNPELIRKLPIEVQTAIKQIVNTPQELRPLPSQVQPALASRGQSPMQLLLGLLAGLQSSVPTSDKTSPSPQLLTSVQHFINSKEPAVNQTQTAVRALEVQVMRELLREVESATARIQYNQLAMVKDPDLPSNTNVWLFDLPVKDKQQLDMLQLKLEQHLPELTGDDEAIWQVQLNLETQNLGPMQAQISLHQFDVKVVLLAERQQSAQLLSRHMDELNQRLDKLGVNVSHLSCRQAEISPLTAEVKPELSSRLLDISV
jgi:hypothetical protein